MFIATTTLALTTIAAAVVVPKFIEGAARKQCQTQDWPAHQHKDHFDFCLEHGYEVGKLGPAY